MSCFISEALFLLYLKKRNDIPWCLIPHWQIYRKGEVKFSKPGRMEYLANLLILCVISRNFFPITEDTLYIARLMRGITK